MKILRFDSTGGASGDMVLASLIDLGASLDAIRSGLESLDVDPFEISAGEAVDGGLRGTRVKVTSPALDHHAHAHRTLGRITAMINRSGLPPGVKKSSLEVFQRLAGAEAKVHGTTPDKIHFHEVGAVDSIVDIVSSCLALEMLGAGRVELGPLPDGRGVVEMAHGVMPLPVPAVAELMKGYQLVQTDEPYELVTPTGAALLTTWEKMTSASGPGAGRPLTVVKTGYGIGHRKLQSRPNTLRAMLMETVAPAPSTDECAVLECNVDDTVPELIGSLTQALMDNGALDVFTTAIQMKKQRPGTLLTVLCWPGQKAAMLDLIFRGSTTFGVREHTTGRTVLERRHVEVETPHGKVRVKIGTWQGRDITWAPEYEDCARCAREKGVPVRTVYESALRAAPKEQ